jgi:nitrogen fixation protein NifB
MIPDGRPNQSFGDRDGDDNCHDSDSFKDIVSEGDSAYDRDYKYWRPPVSPSLPAEHPCFSTECQPNFGRLHLPVAPVCNIFCRFCSRGLSPDITLPGQALRVISPGEALGVAETAMTLCPEIRVAGVAGPGDPLASPDALDCLTLIKSRHPRIMTCLSTNGLNLYPLMERIVGAGVRTVTVTVNACDPAVSAEINRGVKINGKVTAGIKAAEILYEAQKKGVLECKRRGILVKVNCVLVPGVNLDHAPRVAETAASWGADLMNLIPLAPASAMAHLAAPTKEEADEAARLCQKHLPVKRNCMRCRSDACGIPGVTERRRELYGADVDQETFSHG